VKKARVFQKLADGAELNQSAISDSFIFFEKSTGMVQFRAESSSDQGSTVERVAAMLAMQCLVRGHDPDEFMILVPAEQVLAKRFQERAKELLDEGRVVTNPASLSPRQNEILYSVIRNQANKEIASKLNITVRTVKFHISSLLNKFGVDNRVDLARRAAGFLRPVPSQDNGHAYQEEIETEDDREFSPVRPMAMSPAVRPPEKLRGVRFAGRELPA
jgi:DNA-binding CsgD family transcriptional regulator